MMEHWKHTKEQNEKRSFFRRTMFEYLSRSKVQGYIFIVQADRPLYERVLWILFTVFGITVTFYLVLNSYVTFMESPTVTSEAPIKTPILKLNFPAVSVCNANRIGRKALLDYSRFIEFLSPESSLNATQGQSQHIGRTVDEVFESLVTIGQMYTMEANDDDLSKMEDIHVVMSNIYGGSYSAYDIMLRLAPNCSDILKACKWQGHHVECSQIFTTRKTFMGPCCTFNYQRPLVSILKLQQQFNHTIPTFKTPERVNSHGPDFGLTFLVDHQLDDYVFTMNEFIGSVALIFDANDFPDQLSGAVREKIISPQQEVYLALHPTLIRGSRTMKSFEISTRNCVFNDEINLVFANFYSFSECLFTCRVNNIIETCGCAPPHFTNIFNSSECTFKDLACLTHWCMVWLNFESNAVNDVHCPTCLPKCNRLQHIVHTSNSHFDPLEAMERSHDPNFINFTDIAGHSIVSVNFGTNRVTEFEQTATYVWYELLANLGSVGSLSLGATMVSIIEIIYFFSGKLGAIWIRNRYRRGRNDSKFEFVN